MLRKAGRWLNWKRRRHAATIFGLFLAAGLFFTVAQQANGTAGSRHMLYNLFSVGAVVYLLGFLPWYLMPDKEPGPREPGS